MVQQAAYKSERIYRGLEIEGGSYILSDSEERRLCLVSRKGTSEKDSDLLFIPYFYQFLKNKPNSWKPISAGFQLFRIPLNPRTKSMCREIRE